MVKTTVRDLGNPYNSTYRERLTKHLCAEPGCQEGLGWLYEGPRRHSQGGAGTYRDQRVLDHLKRVQLEPDTDLHLWMTGWTGMLIMSMALCGGAASLSASRTRPEHPPPSPRFPSRPKTAHQATPATSAAASHKKAPALTAAAKEQHHQSAAAPLQRQGRRARITKLNPSKKNPQGKKGDQTWA